VSIFFSGKARQREIAFYARRSNEARGKNSLANKAKIYITTGTGTLVFPFWVLLWLFAHLIMANHTEF